MARTLQRFPEKRVLITGAGSGLGRALAVRFATDGWRVGIADFNTPRAEESAALATKAGGRPLVLYCDVTVPEDLERTAGTLKERWGGIDILINNAGISAAGIMEDIPLEEWDRIISCNFKSVIYGCRAFIPLMKEQGSGHILNVASICGIASLPEIGSYNATKAAVISLSETLRAELAGHGIGVTVACPSFVQTNFMEGFRCTDDSQIVMADFFFNRATCTADDFARRAVRDIAKNRLYSMAQLDARLVWRLKRGFPGLYARLVVQFVRRLKNHLFKNGT